MAIEFFCGTCNTTLRVPDEHAGKQAKCPKCQALNQIPQASEPASTAPAPAMAPMKFDGNPNPYTPSTIAPNGGVAGRAYMSPHRGGLILTMGILALVCNFFLIPGIMAWVLGRSDLKEIAAGNMDPEGRGMTQAGMILGIIGTSFFLLTILIYIAAIVAVMIFGAAAAAGGGNF